MFAVDLREFSSIVYTFHQISISNFISFAILCSMQSSSSMVSHCLSLVLAPRVGFPRYFIYFFLSLRTRVIIQLKILTDV